MLTLSVDLGNSRVKWAVGASPARKIPLGEFLAAPERVFPDGCGEVWYAASHPEAGELLRREAERRGVPFVRAREHCPLAAEYGPGLGDDRLLAAWWAVRHLGAPTAVIGCGTALTADLVEGRPTGSVFVGGAILAGEERLLAGLGSVGPLPAVTPGEAKALPASTTEDCLRAGAHAQAVSGLRESVNAYAAGLGLDSTALPLLLHGGGAERYRSLFPRAVLRETAVLDGIRLCRSESGR